MKNLIYTFIAVITLGNNSNAQFNVMDSATLIQTYNYYGSYDLASTPTNAPAGPDYSNLSITTHPKWFRWTVCGTDQVNYNLSNRLITSSAFSVAIWGPFNDTVGITNKLNATHLNQYYNLQGFGNFNLPKADSVGIYIMLICSPVGTGTNVLIFDDTFLPALDPILYYDNRCNICSTSIVNYQQKICTVSYDTAYRTYTVFWDKQNNLGIASFDVLRANSQVGNVPINNPGVFSDPNLDSIYYNLWYQLIAVDSCGNSAPALGYSAGAPYSYGNASSNFSNFQYTFKLTGSPPPSVGNIFVFRGSNESNMQLIDSNPSSGPGVYVDYNAPQGLCYYSFTYNNVSGCHPDATTTVNEVRTNSTLVQHICMVAFDSVQQKNVVLWDKQDNHQIDHFNIYREGSVIGQFDSIGWVPETAPALFVDMGVNPNTKSYKYLVRPVNADGTFPIKSSTGSHTTMHMQASPGLFGEVNLSWNAYAGFDYQTFYLYRGTSLSALQVIDSIASNSFTYTDYTPPAGLNFYRVAVRNPYGCHPDSSTIVFESRSNPAYAVVTAISDLQAQQLKLYPNPAKDFTVLDYNLLPEIKHFELINSIGNTINTFEGNAQHKITINTTNLSKGVYYLSAKTDKGLLRKKLVVL